jgi:predicted amidohydrolase
MKISVAQTRAVKGDIQQNIANHRRLIGLAVAANADMIIFSELSITGYEPELAKELATHAADTRFDDFQVISDKHDIIIGVGIPTHSEKGIRISMIIFQPHQQRETYSKQYLHSDEFPFFVNGDKQVFLTKENKKIALAICYELSVDAHSENAHANQADIYIASVAEHIKGVEKSGRRLPAIAEKYGMLVLRANSIGPNDNFYSAGQSAIWDSKGKLLAQLNAKDEGVLIMDTDLQQVAEIYI